MMGDIEKQIAKNGLGRSGAGLMRIKEMHMNQMKEIDRINTDEHQEKLRKEAEEMLRPVTNCIELLEGEVEWLELELEEERQENAVYAVEMIMRGVQNDH